MDSVGSSQAEIVGEFGQGIVNSGGQKGFLILWSLFRGGNSIRVIILATLACSRLTRESACDFSIKGESHD